MNAPPAAVLLTCRDCSQTHIMQGPEALSTWHYGTLRTFGSTSKGFTLSKNLSAYFGLLS